MTLPKWLADKRDELWANDALSGNHLIAARAGFNACYPLMKEREDKLVGVLKYLRDEVEYLEDVDKKVREVLKEVDTQPIPMSANIKKELGDEQKTN